MDNNAFNDGGGDESRNTELWAVNAYDVDTSTYENSVTQPHILSAAAMYPTTPYPLAQCPTTLIPTNSYASNGYTSAEDHSTDTNTHKPPATDDGIISPQESGEVDEQYADSIARITDEHGRIMPMDQWVAKMERLLGPGDRVARETEYRLNVGVVFMLTIKQNADATARRADAIHNNVEAVAQTVDGIAETVEEVFQKTGDAVEKVEAVAHKISQLEAENQSLRSAIERLEEKVQASVTPRTRGRTLIRCRGDSIEDDRSRSPSPEVYTPVKRSDRDRRKLTIKIPEGDLTHLSANMPTPLTTASVAPSGLSFPDSPLTPNRRGPRGVQAEVSLLSPGALTLNSILPAMNVKLPMVPLTDTEVVVFFFLHLARPIVTLRLYSRNWAPSTITNAFNQHRDLDQPYLRNTTAVKCSSALKRGRAANDHNWEAKYQKLFLDADDDKATEMIRHPPSEALSENGFEMRKLAIGLKKLPEVGVDGGIFTRCVKYCAEHNEAFTLNQAHLVAAEILKKDQEED